MPTFTKSKMLMQNKYRNKPTIVDNQRFASKREAERYKHLKLLLQSGEISQLELQPVYPIIINEKFICKYLADFRYLVVATGEQTTEDVKSAVTAKNPVYRLKKKLVEALYDITIVEV